MTPRLLQTARPLAAGAILFAALVRLLSAHSRFPWWEVDPTRQFLPETTLRPSHGLMLDLIVWVASAVGVGACVLLGERLRWRTGMLALAGAAWALVIGMFQVRAGSAADDLALGSAWAAAVVGAWAITHLARDRAVRAGLIAVIAGTAWVLAFKGGYQVFVEHPATVAHFKGNADAVLIAQGLEPGSSGAREFERRLMQAEATGWVGLSNAHASIMGACLILGLGLAVAGVRAARAKQTAGGAAGVLVLGSLAAAAGLAMTGSKGGITAALLGVMIAIVALLLAIRTQRRSASPDLIESPDQRAPSASDGSEKTPLAHTRGSLAWLALAMPLLALAAVAVRGLIGERLGWLGELSLLFRSQYLEGSIRIIADAFPSGVGPGGFKAAYALHKPSLSPETVESPHSIFFDWLACLGLAGAAWCGLLMTWTALAGRFTAASLLTAYPPTDAPEPTVLHSSSSTPIWLMVPIFACATAWQRESPTIPLDEYPIRAVAMLAWVAAVSCALRVTHGRAITACLFGAGIALVTHAQIEVTTVLPATASFALLLIALAATEPQPPAPPPAEPRAQARRHPPTTSDSDIPFTASRLSQAAAVALIMALPTILIARNLSSFSRWESSLRSAAEAARPIADTRAALVAGEAEPAAAAETIRAASDLVARHLHEVSKTRPNSLRADEAATRLLVGVATDLTALRQPEAAKAAIARAVAHLEAVETRDGGRRPELFASTAAGAYQALHRLDADPKWLEAAAERWRIVINRDPTALTPVLRLIDALSGLASQTDEIRDLARKALELNENLRLDPIKQMSPAVRARIEALADTDGAK
ncbi:MAG: O-antigen ligase family protein [Phycisphaerales bacterium]